MLFSVRTLLSPFPNCSIMASSLHYHEAPLVPQFYNNVSNFLADKKSSFYSRGFTQFDHEKSYVETPDYKNPFKDLNNKKK